MQRRQRQQKTRKARDKGGGHARGLGRNSGVRAQIRLQLEQKKREDK